MGRLEDAKSSMKEFVNLGILTKFVCQKSRTSLGVDAITTRGLGFAIEIWRQKTKWPPCDKSELYRTKNPTNLFAKKC